MPSYQWDPRVELQGNSVQAFLTSLTHENYRHILEKHGLDQVDAQSWYRLQDVLNVLSEIADQSGGMMDLVGIGMAAAEVSLIPPEAAEMPVSQFFKAYEQLYPTRFRNGDPGWVSTEIVNERHVIVTSYVPFPDDLWYGLYYGLAKRLSPPGARFVVKYDSERPRREQGGDSTVFHIIWD
jgi:hypothetical protein